MFSHAARAALRQAPRVARTSQTQRRKMSSFDNFYKTALKSNMSQITFVVVGAIIFEVIYGSATEALWNNANQGVRFRAPPARPAVA